MVDYTEDIVIMSIGTALVGSFLYWVSLKRNEVNRLKIRKTFEAKAEQQESVELKQIIITPKADTEMVT
jgi:hypothetical protein